MTRLMFHQGSDEELSEAVVTQAALMWSLCYVLTLEFRELLEKDNPELLSNAVLQMQETAGVLYYNRDVLHRKLSAEDYERLADLAGFHFMDVALKTFEETDSLEAAAKAFMRAVQSAKDGVSSPLKS